MRKPTLALVATACLVLGVATGGLVALDVTQSLTPVRAPASVLIPSASDRVQLGSVLAAFAQAKRDRLDLSVGRPYGPEDREHNRKLHSLQVEYLPGTCYGPTGSDVANEDALRIYAFVLKPLDKLLLAKPNTKSLQDHHDAQKDADIIITTCGKSFGDDKEDMFSPIGQMPRFGLRVRDDDHIFQAFLERIAVAVGVPRRNQ